MIMIIVLILGPYSDITENVSGSLQYTGPRNYHVNLENSFPFQHLCKYVKCAVLLMKLVHCDIYKRL